MKRVYVSLSSSSINKAIEALEQYKRDINRKLQTLVTRLMDLGIGSANENSGEYAGMITFTKTIEPNDAGVEAVLIATDGQKIIREWKYQGGIKQAEVSPLLMAEFGSGWLAKVLDPIEGVGQGTFPNQTHAFDIYGWWWTTPDGERHHSRGEAPTYPVHSALFTMMFEVERIAKEVFNGE